MHNKVKEFSKLMQTELDANSHKGEWEDFTNQKDILLELEYHKSKLFLAIKEDDNDAIKEYSADCANILLCLLNSRDLI